MPKYKAPLSVNLRKYLSIYPGVFEIDGDVLYCLVCNKPVRCERKFIVDQHLRTTKHKELSERRSEKTKSLITTSGEAYISADIPFSNGGRVTWPVKHNDPLQPSSSTSDYAVHIKKPMSSDQDEYEDTRLEMQYSPILAEPVVGFKRKPRFDSEAAAAAANNDIDDAFCEALQSFKKLCETRENRKGNEALHGFVQMIYATMAGMSTEKQTRAMLRVTEIVMQIKMEPDG